LWQDPDLTSDSEWQALEMVENYTALIVTPKPLRPRMEKKEVRHTV
jgi:hypothetical protein